MNSGVEPDVVEELKVCSGSGSGVAVSGGTSKVVVVEELKVCSGSGSGVAVSGGTSERLLLLKNSKFALDLVLVLL